MIFVGEGPFHIIEEKNQRRVCEISRITSPYVSLSCFQLK